MGSTDNFRRVWLVILRFFFVLLCLTTFMPHAYPTKPTINIHFMTSSMLQSQPSSQSGKLQREMGTCNKNTIPKKKKKKKITSKNNKLLTRIVKAWTETVLFFFLVTTQSIVGNSILNFDLCHQFRVFCYDTSVQHSIYVSSLCDKSHFVLLSIA